MSTLRRKVVALGAAVALTFTTGSVVAARALSKSSSLTPREEIAANHKVEARSEHKSVRLATRSFDPLEGEPSLPAALRTADARYWLVQVEYPATKATRLAITAAGAEILSSLPEVTYLVRAGAVTAEAVRHVERVRWVGAYHPAYKLSPALAKVKDAVEVNVWAHEGVDARTLVPAIAAAAGKRPTEARRAVVSVSADKTAVNALARLEDVAWIERKPVYKLHNSNALWLDDTGERDKLNATAPGRLDGTGQTAAVADTGINYIPDDNGRAQKAFSDCNAAGVCKLADFTSGTPGDTTEALEDHQYNATGHRKMAGYFNLDADDPKARSMEPSWHGTHVSGSVAGDYPDAAGAYGTRNREADGIAVGARLVFQDIEADGGLGGIPSDPYELYNQVYDLDGDNQYDPLEDARTHNNSYGAIYPEIDATGGGARTDDFIYDHPDMVVVFSASNDGPGEATLSGGPQESKNVITSCAAANGRQPLVSPDAVAIFSSHGPTPDGRIKPDVCTPGQINVSPKGGTVDDDQYLQGTSMSGPLLVGFVTLVRQYFWDGFGPSGIQGFAKGTRDFDNRHNPSSALVKAVTINSAQRMRGYYSGDDGENRDQDGMWPSAGQGWGKVELDKALYFPGDDRALYTVDRPNDAANGLETNDENNEFIDVAPGQPLDVTLTWIDPSNALGAGVLTLVNDLDLVVTAPDGTQYLGNEFTTQSPVLGPGGDPAADVNESVAGGLADNVNNVEGVRLAAPKPGRYKVTVKGTNVQEGPQGYALAVSGRIATDQPRVVFDAPKYQPGAAGTAYLLGTGLSGDTIDGFTKLGTSVYEQKFTAGGSQVSLSGGGVTGTAPVDSTAPAVSNVLVDTVAADLARVTWKTDENSTGEVVVTGPDGEKVFGDVYNVAGFPGLTTPQAETKGNFLNKKVNTTSHEVSVTGLKAGQQYSYVIRSTDEAGNTGSTAAAQFTSTAAMFSPNAPDIAMLLSGDLTTGLPETPDLNLACGTAPITTCQSWGTSTQLYAGSFATSTLAVEAMPAFMFRLPSSVDPSKITGAAVELYSGHDIVDPYNDDPVYSVDLLDSAVESGWGPGKTYGDVKDAAADVEMAADVTLRRGANQAYTWHVPCNKLEAFKTNLAEDTGDERHAAFRLEATTPLDESLFSFETGYGRRSRGPQLRPRLILFMDGLDPMPCTATAAPKITTGAVDHVKDTTAVVSWRTDVPSDSTVQFRKVGATEWTPVSAPVRVTQHFVEIAGLEAHGQYEFVVTSATCNGLSTTDTNGGKSYALFNEAFVPANLGAIFAKPDPADPAIELVGWGTDQKTTSVVRYGTSPTNLDKEVKSDTATDTHQLELTGLQPCTRYYFTVSGANGAGKVSTSDVMAFDTPAASLAEVAAYDFEADEQGWTNSPPDGTGTEGDPLLGEQLTDNPTIWTRRAEPSTGSFAMRTTLKLTDTPGYSSNVDQRLVSPPIAIPAGFAVLEWEEWFLFEQGVEGVFTPKEEPVVEYSLDNGSTWIKLRKGVLTQNADFPATSTVRLGLPAATSGQTIRVAFHMQSDGNTEPPGGGWAVDNVKILSGACGSLAVADPSVPVAPDAPQQQLTSTAIHEAPGPIDPVDGSGAPIGVLAAFLYPPSTASLNAGTCRCTEIRYLGLNSVNSGPVVPVQAVGGESLPATGGSSGLWPALAAGLVAVLLALRRRLRLGLGLGRAAGSAGSVH